jgi:dienelactone hydrolase
VSAVEIAFSDVMPLMRMIKVLVVLLALGTLPGQVAMPKSSPYGNRGAEGEPDRAQEWLVPSPAQYLPASAAMLFRPPGDGPFRLAVIAHASTQNALRRMQTKPTDYRALAAFLVARGFAVLVPVRLGHPRRSYLGDGIYLEDQDGCDDADYLGSGRGVAVQIGMALQFLRGQSFIRKDGAVVIGHSAGGWGALALTGEDAKGVAAIIAFAPGRGGHADDVPNRVCAPDRLIAAAFDFGKSARVPVTWLLAANDSYFSPDLSRQLVDAFRSAGGAVDFHVLPASGSEGHWMAETEEGIGLATTDLDRAQAPAINGAQETMTLYFLIKYLHVLGAIVILGTGSGIAFFMLMAHRSRDVAFIARTAATVVLADVLFTLTAVIL